MIIYITNERPGHGKQNYYWNEYRLEEGRVVKYRCHRQRIFDGRENDWHKSERAEAMWVIDDPAMPEWLKKYLP